MLKRIAIFLALLLCSTSVVIEAQNKTDKSKVQRQKQETTKRLKQNTRQFEKNKAETARRLKELSQIEGEIVVLNREIQNRQHSIDSLKVLIDNVSDTINDLNTRLEDLSSKYAAALKQHQGSFQSPSTISYLFASETVSQAMRRYRALKQFSKWRARKTSEITLLKEKLQDRRDELEKYKKTQASILEDMSLKQKDLSTSRKKNEELISNLKKRSSEIKSIIDNDQKELKRLEKRLDEIIAEEQRRIEEERRKEEERRRAEEARLAEQRRLEEEKRQAELKAQQENKKNSKQDKSSSKNNKSDKSSNNKKQDKTASTVQQSSPQPTQMAKGELTSRNGSQLSQGFAAAKGKLPYPVDGRHVVVRGFGRQKHPELPMIETDNPGIDISVDNGDKARAIYEGEVSAIFKQPGYNNVIMVRHGVYLTIYANLENIEVVKGQRVAAGQALGKVARDNDDSKGRAIMHFEIRHEKDKENPSLWLR